MTDVHSSPLSNRPLSLRIFPSPQSHRKLLSAFAPATATLPLRWNSWKGRPSSKAKRKVCLTPLITRAGKNVFLFGGTLMTGAHSTHFSGTAAMILISWVEYALLVIPFTHASVLYVIAVGLCTITIALLGIVSFTDPGIQPRQHFRNDRSASTTLIKKDAAVLNTNFCKICCIWRPNRARHCRYCDNCVDVFDHHCPVSSIPQQ
jgi:hypothetical protein